MAKLEDGMQKVIEGLQMAVEGYNESIAGKRSLDEQMEDLRGRQAHMQETIDALQKMLLEGLR